ncbi:MAG: radical SAM protein [Candidatus Bathyarchaeia archaeon]
MNCIRERPDSSIGYVEGAHLRVRARYGLPSRPPKTPGGIRCDLCSNQCVIGVGEKGYCGLRSNVEGQIRGLRGSGEALLYAYIDPHVTNCCASWFCPAGTGCGYPRYAVTSGPEYGYSNLAVFFYGCNFDCLFCQNASHKEFNHKMKVTRRNFREIVERNRRITCICYFGGSPEPQLPFAVSASREIIEAGPGRVLRICFEWNGCGNSGIVREAAALANESGGNLKFDIKCFDENLAMALCGVSNKRTFENFEMVAKEYFKLREGVPNLTATTLLVPGYVDEREVESIAKFIGGIDPEIPYSLLVFHPDFEMSDLPVTPRRQVELCYSAAKRHLRKVNIGNRHLLDLSYA